MTIPREVVQATRTGQPIRIHTIDGEVLVARILNYDSEKVVVTVLRSSRPERYAVCDATGFPFPHSGIERIHLLDEPGHA